MGVRQINQDLSPDGKSVMLYIALLHYPVYNKNGRIVSTAIANMDIHDIARVAKTYAASGFYIVNPIAEQRKLAQAIVSHWREGYGAAYNQSRREAFQLIKIKASLLDVIRDIAEETAVVPKTIATGARISGEILTFAELKKMLRTNHTPWLLLFGTGSGMANEVVDISDYKLEPINGLSVYNHLSVRSAVAIIMDRVLGH